MQLTEFVGRGKTWPPQLSEAQWCRNGDHPLSTCYDHYINDAIILQHAYLAHHNHHHTSDNKR